MLQTDIEKQSNARDTRNLVRKRIQELESKYEQCNGTSETKDEECPRSCREDDRRKIFTKFSIDG